jgi:tripartite-type tricarboxylate transporter receptor subunit TctC
MEDRAMAKLTRRAVLAGALAMPGIARAQSQWPSGVVTLVVPAPAGGSVDIVARLVQPGLQQRLGTPVIVENRSGGATSIGAAYVAKAARDGSKWLINADPQALNPAFMSSMPFDTEKDLEPVLLVGTSPNVLAANPSTAYRTLADVLEDARKPAGLSFAVIADTLALVSMVLLNKLAAAHFTPVPYRSATQAITDTMGGHLGLVAGSASLLAPYFKTGQLRPIMQTGAQRHPALQELPTVSESGFPGFNAVSFWGFYAPSGTQPAIVERFVADLTATLREPEITTRLRSMLIDPKFDGPALFRAFFSDQLKTWGAVVRDNGLQAK